MSEATATDRATDKLYVQANTIQCAINLCRPCCYKLFIYGGKDVMPNVRPEQCPRFNDPYAAREDDGDNAEEAELEIVPRNVLLQPSHKVLTLGDGNFSFSRALLGYLGEASQLTATSHEAKDTVVETYPDSSAILDTLTTAGASVLHEVDATSAKSLKAAAGATKFDRVIWNFPCVRMPDGADGQNNEMDDNKQLLQGFFTAVVGVLAPHGEVHVTHKTKPPFGQWGVVALAEANGLRHTGSVVFDRCLYPGYSNKKVLSKGSFPIWDSETFVFVRATDKEGSSAGTIPAASTETDGVQLFVGWDAAKWRHADALYPVRPALLRDLRVLLGPANQKQVEAKERARKRRKHVTLPADLLEKTKGKKRKRDAKAADKKKGGDKKGKKIVMQPTKRNKKAKRHS
ncbi:hypothetical protein H257_06262 [Aphanomyces astaci]|uniref:25S rRNA (uridine-N(3))-methyltransferase BMT5-like domain-containing protein n=2 Tax=Aphanomyces astaci TaxID=112090 RepID=W4GM55_APHAT|nr:hypothetical protein H257_06262 [Aphanomyces astaci]ETV80785.1 hypothetical protein H257_06262 [Aphanomyces astaci]RQM26777.1 hypothetical protein B5M09_006532 [Aphanomyces astaci]|eukprot:XP_009829732.1 hypothetical protein H257_06262 [Aphanomyces astaci]